MIQSEYWEHKTMDLDKSLQVNKSIYHLDKCVVEVNRWNILNSIDGNYVVDGRITLKVIVQGFCIISERVAILNIL